MANNGNRPSFEEVYGAYKASNRPSFEEVYGSYQAGRNNTQQHSVSNAYASYGVNSTSQTAIEDYQKRLEGYDWIGEGDYYYDAFSETDQARKAAGEIPEYLYKKYDFDDPDDVVLYGLGLPPKSLIRTVADKADKAKEKAEKEAEEKAEETAYEQYRAQIEEAKKDPFEKLVGGVKAAINKGNALQKETAPKATEEPAAGDTAALTDAVFGGAQPTATQQPNKLGAWMAGLNAKFDNPGAQAYWDRVVWEANNMREATDEELQPLVDELLKTGNYKGSSATSAMATGAGYTTAEEKALQDARDQYRRQQEQKWLEYVGAPKDAEGNFLYGSKYDYEGRVVANEMTQAAVNSAGFKPLEQLQAEAEAEGERLEGIYKTTERTAQMAQPIYMQMTDEQKAAYYYYKERGLGDEYLDALTPELTDKAAEATKKLWTEEFPVPIIGDALLAFTGGLESGTKGLIRLATDNYAARTEGVSSRAAQQNRAEVAQGDDFWSKLAGIGLDVLYSTGNMVPSVVAGTANPILGAVTIGASSAGNAIKEARKEGATEEQAITYGLMSGTAEAALQYLLGGIAKLGKGVTGDALGKGVVRLFSRVLKNPKVAQAFKARAGSILAEAGEEYIQGIIDPVIRNIALNEDNIISLVNEEAGYGALLGAITGGLLGGSGTVAENATTIDTPTAETPAQAQTEAPVEAVQTTGAPAPVGVGDTVTLQDGTTATVQGVSHDPFNNVDMYAVEWDGQIEWLTAQDIVSDSPVTAPQTQNEGNLTDMRNEAIQMADSAFSGRTVVTPASIAGGSATNATTWEAAAPRISDNAGSQWRDVSRVLDDAAGKDKALRDFLYEQIERPHTIAKAAYVRNTQQMTRAMKTAYDSFGIKAKSPESAAVFAYTQGYRLDKNGDRIPYGYGEVVRDFPQTYENIIKASAWTREFLDQYHDLINNSRMGIYENAEQAAQRELENLRGQEIFYSDGIARATSDAQTAETPQARRDAERRADELRGIFNSVQANRMQLEANIASGYYGNKRLAYKSDYMPHYRESPSAWARTLNAFIGDEIRIDPDVVGRTDETRPKSQWSGRFLHQGNGQYVEDAVYALTRYIEEGERLMAFDPVIARMNDPLEGIIQRVRSGTEGRTNANKFIAWAENWTNTLTGKTSGIDRAALALTGNPENRKWVDRIRALNGLVRSSALLGNVRSALVQIGNIPNAMNYIPSPVDWVSGMYRMGGRVVEDIGWKTDNTMKNALEQSNFMAGRTHDYVMRSMDDYTRAPSKAASWLLEIGDRGSSELIWWSAFSQYQRKNGKVKGTRTYESAVDYADDVTRRSVAGRERGDKPVNQTSQIVNLLDPFKLETVNQLNTVREAIKNKRFGGLVASMIGTYLLNEMFDEMFGDTPLGLDFTRVIVDTVKAWVDEEDKSVQNLGDALERMLWRTGGELLASMPLGAQATMLATDETNLENLFGESDPTRYGIGNMGAAALADPILSYFMGGTVDPIASLSNFVPAGKQVNRAIETVEIQGVIPDVKLNRDEGFFTRQAQTPTSYTNTGEVRYAADTDPLNILKSMMFGQYATDAGKAYIGNGMKTLKGDKAETYNALAAAGMDGKDIMEQLNALAGFKEIKKENYKITAADQKREHIEDSDLTTAQQMILMGSIDSSFTENARAAKELGISNEQFLEYEYARVRIEVELQEYKRDHDGDAPPVAKSQQLKNWLRAQGLTEEQALYLYELHDNYKWKGWD